MECEVHWYLDSKLNIEPGALKEFVDMVHKVLWLTSMLTIYGQTLLFLWNPNDIIMTYYDLIYYITSLWLHLLHYDITTKTL